MSMRTNESYCFALPIIDRMLLRHSCSSMSSPICVSFTDTFALGFFGVEYGLAEQVERCREVIDVQVMQRRDCFLHRFARDEARRQLAGEAVLPDETEDARLLAQPEESGAQHQE